MMSQICKSMVVLLLCAMAVGQSMGASGRDTILPAGTILRCVLNEPNFSSATVEIGDPVLCHLRGLMDFNEQAFPRGSYLVGHLVAAKDPGHFFGKGYLKLEFDRIGVPGADVPLTAKVIGTRGYKVDREGKIDGKGHAKRDVAEWMLPPLWPWKVMMLPARGPRPKLKNEAELSLRLMDDVQIPKLAQRFGRERPIFGHSQTGTFSDAANHRPNSVIRPAFSKDLTSAETATVSYAANTIRQVGSITKDPLSVTLFVLNTGTVLSVLDYTLENGRIAYTLAGGGAGVIGFNEVDWNPTLSVNAQRGVGVVLLSRQTSSSPPRVSIPPGTHEGDNRPLTLIVLKGGTAYVAREYWADGWRMHCISENGEQKLFALEKIDLAQTVLLNRERGVEFVVQSQDRSGEEQN